MMAPLSSIALAAAVRCADDGVLVDILQRAQARFYGFEVETRARLGALKIIQDQQHRHIVVSVELVVHESRDLLGLVGNDLSGDAECENIVTVASDLGDMCGSEHAGAPLLM